ncbi:MAG: anti-sigma factor family protein, partial [Candidatus Nanopelagicaceae bacterium]
MTEMPCDQVKHALVLLVDGPEFFEANQIDPISVDRHLERCMPCKLEVEAEKMVHELMRSLLKRSCNEKAPESLIDSIHQQLQAAMFQQSAPQVVTEFRMSQVSIEIDEFGQVTQRE